MDRPKWKGHCGQAELCTRLCYDGVGQTGLQNRFEFWSSDYRRKPYFLLERFRSASIMRRTRQARLARPIKTGNLGVVWQSNVNITGTSHTYTCNGGEFLWERKEDKRSTITLGDGCVRTCPITNIIIPNSVQQVQSPIIFEFNGEWVIVENSAYVLKCRPSKIFID